jgi:cytochrome c oxidase subunit 2
MVLLGIVMLRFNAKAHPLPTKTAHNTTIEVLWTVLPVLTLVGIAIPSFSLLFAQYDPARALDGYDPETNPPLTLKVTGSQWAWSFEYPDLGISVFQTMVQDGARTDAEAQPRLLAVDNPAIIPVGQVIELQVTASDVLHALGVPALGVKVDAVPGRLNELWTMADREGVFYGQCSELCGQPSSADYLTGHAFMPVEVRAVSPEQFQAWAAMASSDLAGAYELLAAMIAEDDGPTRLAAGR